MNNMRNKILSLLVLLLTAASGAWATEVEQSESFTTNTSDNVYTGNNFKITVDSFGDSGGFYLSEIYYATIEALNGETITKVEFTRGYDDINAFSCEVGTTNISGDVATVSGVNQTSLSFSATGPLQIKAVKVYFITAPDVEVTTNAASEGATFTEAWFNMPAFDATAEYELVRDMSVQMQAQVGDDPAKQPRYRVQKTGNNWVPADLNYEQVMALFSVNDLIEKTKLALTSYSVNIYAVDAEGQPTGDAMDFKTFTFAPGRYCVTASANALLDAPYEGTTAPSNIFELFQGYEITVGAGEYVTYYKDEALTIEDEDAELYTISSVSDAEAVLSDKLAMVAANTPMLVYNKGTEAKTFILLPTEQNADELTVAREFRGTLAEKEMPASSTTVDYYVCTGKAFEWVRDAGVIAANKCWLQIGDQPAAARAMTRSIVGGGNTTNMDDVRWQMEDGNYYDLQGRKVAKPTRGGIYIHNGKKVILK